MPALSPTELARLRLCPYELGFLHFNPEVLEMLREFITSACPLFRPKLEAKGLQRICKAPLPEHVNSQKLAKRVGTRTQGADDRTKRLSNSQACNYAIARILTDEIGLSVEGLNGGSHSDAEAIGRASKARAHPKRNSSRRETLVSQEALKEALQNKIAAVQSNPAAARLVFRARTHSD